LLGDFFGVHAVEVTAAVHAAQIEQRHFGVIPGLRAVLAQRLVPELQFFPDPAIDLALELDRLVDRHCLVLALHFDAVDLPEYDVLHRLARRLADQYVHPVALGATLEARGDVHRVAHGGVGAAHLRAHVADTHRAGIDADADFQRRPAASGDLGVELLA